ncbi:hypothetical protein [Clostridium tetani]|uniref:Uncharacterized protein n=1 Tax=Clostridium tetani TaxID=1513 RepID=A0ABY0EP70_CLOTA|nr:hypothetical protein [Clostridium tetani]KHO36214.1 hypothetical protein OR62_11285 [Clostridium tetani]RXI55925.1 hypothetical protein DP131_07720 [Clostridium tetani]RXI66050.1 hypothetical protein DQN76_13395 [Clostridium tetani]CDI50312.1 hypothetical protein BN906_02328 [Clostridium tetani 12124569]
MLSKEVFNKGIEDLTMEFECRGFKMSKIKAIKWYKHMDYMSNEEFTQRIDKVLETNSFPPVMADILNAEIDNTVLRTEEAYKTLEYLKGGINFD